MAFATLSYTAAEYSGTTNGEKPLGYSANAGGNSIGHGIVAYNDGNPFLWIAAGARFTGALKFPLIYLSNKALLNRQKWLSKKFEQAANLAPKIDNVVNIGAKGFAIEHAISNGYGYTATALIAWIIGDIFKGRLHEPAYKAYRNAKAYRIRAHRAFRAWQERNLERRHPQKPFETKSTKIFDGTTEPEKKGGQPTQADLGAMIDGSDAPPDDKPPEDKPQGPGYTTTSTNP